MNLFVVAIVTTSAVVELADIAEEGPKERPKQALVVEQPDGYAVSVGI